MTRDEKYRATQKKNRAYRTRRAMRLIRKGQPKTANEAKALSLTLIEVGKDEGAFRTAHRIQGTDLLIKFPLQYRRRSEETEGGPEVWGNKDGIQHTRMEVKKIRALREFPVMRKNIPPVYYFHSRDGVMVTKYYPNRKYVRSAMAQLITRMVRNYCGVTLDDVTSDNLRVTPDNNLIFIDCGY
jgi:hypothetical protein